MSEDEIITSAVADNFVRIEDFKPPMICVSCVFCKSDIEFRVIPVFPICENCRKILGEFVANHKSNWGK